MAIEPKPSRDADSPRTLSKKFNLLRPGTGIRFIPPEEWPRPGKDAISPLRAVLLLSLMAAAAALYFNLPAPPPARPTATVSISPPPHIMQEETVTANSPAAPDVKPAEVPLSTLRWRIRFGIFLSRENAERHAASLAKKGVSAAVEAALRPMSAFTLKAGPADGAAVWKDLKSAGAKLNVAPMEEVDGKYLVVGPIWLKDRALVAENAFKAVGVRTEIAEERKDREIFKVLSAPFETAEAAKRVIGEMQTNGIEGVVDE